MAKKRLSRKTMEKRQVRLEDMGALGTLKDNLRTRFYLKDIRFDEVKIRVRAARSNGKRIKIIDEEIERMRKADSEGAHVVVSDYIKELCSLKTKVRLS